MTIRILSLLFLLLSFSSAKAEEKPVSMRSFKTVITFDFDKKSQEPRLYEQVEMLFEAQRSHAAAVVSSFYNESSSITQARAYDGRNKRFSPTKVCGNYEDGEVFYSDAKFCTYKVPMELKGEQARLELSKEYTNLRYFTSVYFPYVYDVTERLVEFHIPGWMELELKEFNFGEHSVEKKEWLDKKGIKVIQYNIKELKAFEEGPYLPGKSHTYPHIVPVVKGYTNKGQRQKLLSTTADLYSWYAGLVNEVENETDLFKDKLAEIISGKSAGRAQIEAVYYWVQDNIRYIAFEEGIAGFKPEACQLVYQNRYGDCKGMANLTKQMLRQAGYDARLAWIGTNSLAYTYEIPSLAVDNHMICVVYHEGDTLVLDATEKFIGLNDIAERIQGKQMMIENGADYSIQQVPVLTASRNRKLSRYTMRFREDKILGEGHLSLQGEQRTALLYYCNNVRNEGSENLIKRFIIGESKSFQIKEMNYSALDDRLRPFEIDFSFELQNKLTAYGKELYWQPDPKPEYSQLKVEEGRLNALDFKEKIDELTEVSLVLPTGYKVSHLPQNLQSQSAEFSVSVKFEQKGNKVIYRRQVQIPTGRVSVSAFKAWNAAVQQLDEKYREQVILTKK